MTTNNKSQSQSQSTSPSKPLLTAKISNTSDPFWSENPLILFQSDRLVEIYPSPSMSMNEKLNAIVRLLIVISVLTTLYTQNTNYLVLILVGLLGTYAIYYYDRRLQSRPVNPETFKSDGVDRNVVYPTRDNPFMNPLLTDYIDNPNRIAASALNTYDNPLLVDKINENFYYNLYSDITDVYSKQNSQRQFYTMPATTIPNEQGKFAQWLYGKPPTCKEGNGLACVANNNDLRKGSEWRSPLSPDVIYDEGDDSTPAPYW